MKTLRIKMSKDELANFLKAVQDNHEVLLPIDGEGYPVCLMKCEGECVIFSDYDNPIRKFEEAMNVQ